MEDEGTDGSGRGFRLAGVEGVDSGWEFCLPEDLSSSGHTEPEYNMELSCVGDDTSDGARESPACDQDMVVLPFRNKYCVDG